MSNSPSRARGLIHLVFLVMLASSVSIRAMADPAPFDLAGPTLEVRVTRGGKTLPISQVPNLLAGDHLAIKADLPPTQSAHYLLVAAFLSGSTNPPPNKWFFRCQTWETRCARDGISVTIPEGALQALLFLAPETSGDFRTLVKTVRARPGAFVRASQDLNQAALHRARLDRYLDSVRKLDEANPAALRQAAPMLARSLAMKVDEHCLDKSPEIQAACLLQNGDSSVLSDSHSQSMVAALTSGPVSELAMEATLTPHLGSGYYGPYVASILDIARIFDSFRTAQYQYIPALSRTQGEKIRLSLNAAPSFSDPMSVLVATLPAIERSPQPPLRALDPQQRHCAGRSPLLLPVEGAPLVFATDFAHDLVLSINVRGKVHDAPVHVDPVQGGLVVDTRPWSKLVLEPGTRATLQGRWGFDAYDGPQFALVSPDTGAWELAAGDAAGLIVGRQSTIHLRAPDVTCTRQVELRDANGVQTPAPWKRVNESELEVQLPLQQASPGEMALLISQFGTDQAQSIPIRTFAEAGRLDRIVLHAGDANAVLKGSRLDKVRTITINGVELQPGTLATRFGNDELPLTADPATTLSALTAGQPVTARVTLQDGRAFNVPVDVQASRPQASLIGKRIQPARSDLDTHVQLVGQDQLPNDARLVFSLRMAPPQRFDRATTVEIANADESASVTLGVSGGGVTLENQQIAVVTLDPGKGLGPSTFGPLRFRIRAGDVAGDWQPLVTLIRRPVLSRLHCPQAADAPCTLSGTNLFLIDSISPDSGFANAVKVPEGYLGNAIEVPQPAGDRIYLKLRDDPAVINPVTLSVQRDASASPAGSAPADATPPAPASPAPPVPPPQDTSSSPPAAGSSP